MIGDVFVELGPGCGDGLENVAEFEAQSRALVADLVVGLLQFFEVEVFFRPVGEFDRVMVAIGRVIEPA